MNQTYFVTGTDTDVGKTVCCAALLQAAKQQGLSTLAYKPIAAGCESTCRKLTMCCHPSSEDLELNDGKIYWIRSKRR